jgi:acetate kinase
MFCYRVGKYICAYMAVLGRTDAIAFGGSIGEHSDNARELVCSGLDALGIIVDPEGQPPRQRARDPHQCRALARRSLRGAV